MPKPNVLFILTDQQRFDTTGVHGNPLDLTPNFDRMAMEGTHLYHAFTPQPVCGPARACLQTGIYATQNGCWRNGIPLDPSHNTLAKIFNQAGYLTSYIGKWHLADSDPVSEPFRGGYQNWLASNALEFTSDAYHTTVYDNDERPITLPGYRVDALTDAAIRFIHTSALRPFFLFLSFLEPHFQNHRDDYPAPVGYAERFIGRWTPPDLQALGGGTSYQHLPGYYGMVKRIDEALGRLLDALRSLDLLDNTIVVFTSDHGNHFKTRNSEYKRSCHDGSIRIPMAIQGPGFISGGRIMNLVTLLDLPPTLLDACGIQIPHTMVGHSILRLAQKQENNWPDDVFIQISESQVGRAVRTRRWKYAVVDPQANGNSTSHSQRYVETELYDLMADPYELNNLIGYESHHQVTARLRERLINRMNQAGEDTPEIIQATPVAAGQKMVFQCEIDA